MACTLGGQGQGAMGALWLASVAGGIRHESILMAVKLHVAPTGDCSAVWVYAACRLSVQCALTHCIRVRQLHCRLQKRILMCVMMRRGQPLCPWHTLVRCLLTRACAA